MEDADVYAISVEVAPRFLDDQSAPEDGRYAFAYTIRIHNQGVLPRAWSHATGASPMPTAASSMSMATG